MPWVVQFSIAFVVATVVIALATQWIIDKAVGYYRYVYDPQGNHAKVVRTVVKSLSFAAIGIASGINAPSIIKAFFDGIGSLMGR